MRTINVDGKEIGLRATPLASIYYNQEFGTDIVGDLVKLMEMEKDPSKMNMVTFLKITWAMAKANEGMGVQFPDFITWASSLESFDISDENILSAIMEEAERGFFRKGAQQSKVEKIK
jgi:hypothetical protein